MSGCGWSRRRFLMLAAGTAGIAGGMGISALAGAGTGRPDATVAVAAGSAPGDNVRRAVGALGGMKAFVSRGDVVVLKPNIGWDRTPAQAANTDPGVVVALAEMCLSAGAKEVRVFDRTCNEPRRCYASSGIQEAVTRFARESGAGSALRIYHVEDRKFVRTGIPGGLVLKEWDLYRDALEADRIVNVPVAKHHSLATLTLGLKNAMGLMGGNRGQIHFRLAEALVDVNRRLPPSLTVIDATRILLRNGPSGGSLADVKPAGMLIASADVVAADVLAAERLFNLTPSDVPHIGKAIEAGLGAGSRSAMRVVAA